MADAGKSLSVNYIEIGQSDDVVEEGFVELIAQATSDPVPDLFRVRDIARVISSVFCLGLPLAAKLLFNEGNHVLDRAKVVSHHFFIVY